MPLAALIICSAESGIAVGPLASLLTVAGQTLIEYQARLASHVGASHTVVLVDQMPSGLVAAFDRLRADGINIEIARDARDAADRIHPDENLIVMASGAVAARDIVATLAGSTRATLLTVAEAPQHQHFERIDASSRWAGMALIDGALLRRTAALLGDWTLGPTLLRTAVQAGAYQHSLPTGADVALLNDQVTALAFSNSLARGSPSEEGGWFARTVINAVARRVTPMLLARGMPLEVVTALPLVLLGSSVLLALTGWLATAFAILLMASIPAAIATIMTSIGARVTPLLPLFARIYLPAACILLIAASWALMEGTSEWGGIVMALWASSLMLLSQGGKSRKNWHADAHTLAIVMLLAIALGQPVAGFVLVIVHALATCFDGRRVRANI